MVEDSERGLRHVSLLVDAVPLVPPPPFLVCVLRAIFFVFLVKQTGKGGETRKRGVPFDYEEKVFYCDKITVLIRAALPS